MSRFTKIENYIHRFRYIPRRSSLIFLFCIIIFSWIYEYQEILFLSPQGIHQWRQCDCLSFTMNYYQDNNPFLKPALHFLGKDGTGRTISEFPILYYLTGKLWKIFGPHEYIYRMINLLIFFSGLFALFRLLENILKDSIWAILIPFLLFTSPVLAFYANNFLTNSTALGLSLIAWYVFWLYFKKGRSLHLYLAILIFTLAGLLKITASINLIALFIIFLFELLRLFTFRNNHKLFPQPITHVIPFLIAFALIFIWYLYVQSYNFKHNAGGFLVGILPIWDLEKDQVSAVIQSLELQLKQSYFRPVTYYFLLLAFAATLIFLKNANTFLVILQCLFICGIFLFGILFFSPLMYHDYYILNLYVVVPAICLSFLVMLRKRFPGLFKSSLISIAMIVFVIHNLDFANRRMRDRYSGWMNENYTKYMHSFENISPYLRSIGIEKSDKVICLPDESLNISLYFMNQKGWTQMWIQSDSSQMRKTIDMGADYLIIYDETVYEEDFIQPFIINMIGEFDNIDIYSLTD